MQNVKVLLVGFGVVGKGVAKVLLKKEREIRKQNLDIRLLGVCTKSGSVIDEKGVKLSEVLEFAEKGRLKEHPLWSQKRALNIISSINADIVVEVTPTNIETGEPGLSHILTALNSGKHVVTSNKGPLALKFWELVEKAEENHLKLRYEASVCSGLPTFNLVRNALYLNNILSIKGILNGTTNFILTKMHEEEVSLSTAMAEAREMGICEADPTYDVEGIDAAAKLVILANSIMKMRKTYSDVERTGINEITSEAVQLAKNNGYVIKLIGEVSKNTLEVAPRLIPRVHPLNVSGTLNALMFKTDLINDIFIIGKGAGQIETASAVLSDIIEIAKN